MDTPLYGERVAEEKAFTRRYLDSIASRAVNYPADYAPPLEDRPRKVPVVGAQVVAPPDMDVDDEGGAQGELWACGVVCWSAGCTGLATASVKCHFLDLPASPPSSTASR
jgi:hypothetical protein